MNFSQETEKIMKPFISKFDKFLLKKSPLEQKKMDNILKILYNEIKMAFIWANANRTLQKIKTHLREGGGRKNIIPAWIMHESRYIPKNIANYIVENNKGYIIYNIAISDRDVEIYFGLLNDSDLLELGKFDKYVNKMITWLKMAFSFAPAKCSKKLKIYVFLTPLKKSLPNNQLKILSPNNCNSAVTMSCSPHGEIIVYRKEEFFKVFIHETFHTLGLDFSNMQLKKFNERVKTLFPIKSDFNLFEAYAEFWASKMNSLFTSFYLLDDKNDLKQFLLYSDFCIRFEQIFSLFQMIKILDFMGLKYPNLYSNDKVSLGVRRYLFKEKTNVFAYYIIKTLLLYKNIDFLSWCKEHNNNIMTFNKSPGTLLSFLKFIEMNHNNGGFLNDVVKMNAFLKKMKGTFSKPKDSFLTKTMRMSVCEIE